MPTKTPNRTLSFSDHLGQALKHFNDVKWLGTYSPLASPYFLGDYLNQLPKDEAERPSGRGKALQRLLRNSAEVLRKRDDVNGVYQYRLLQISFFQPQPMHDILAELSIARSSYYAHRDQTLQLLEEVLVQQHSPALRLETQVPPPRLFARHAVSEACAGTLRQGKTVGLHGPAGIGKTAVAAHVANLLRPQPTFWFTIHLGLNDRLNHLLFSLAYFLQYHGAPDLWLQIVADEGRVDLDVVPGILRHDLQKLAVTPPILCFDEVDLLDPAVEAHAQIINFLHSLTADVAMMFIGQQVTHVTVETTQHYTLAELPEGAVREMLQAEDIELNDTDLARLHTFTLGNPRLLILFMVLHRTGEPLPAVLQDLAVAPSLEVVLNRIWRKLQVRERQLLAELSVYRRPAPIDNWPDPHDQYLLYELIERQLIQSDGRGGVALLVAYRGIIYGARAPEERAQLHVSAASARAGRAEYTEAAYHLVQAHKPDLAVRLWYIHRHTEVNQGQAEAAIMLFGGVSREQIGRKDQGLLALIRAELGLLTGEYGPARADLRAPVWQQDLFGARKDRLVGDIAEVTGELDAARLAYLEGLSTVEGLLSKEAIIFHHDIGWIERREHNYVRAWQELQVAEYEMADLRGDIERDQGKFEEAKAYYLHALKLATDSGNVHGEAKTCNALAAVFAQQGDFDAATHYWENAYQCFKRIGKLSSLPSVRVNQATGRILAGQPAEAVPLAEDALRLFANFEQPFGIAVSANTLAEAHLALADLTLAEQYVGRVLETEEDRIISDALRIWAELELARGNHVSALAHCQQSIKSAQTNRNRYIEAYAWRVMGRIYAEQADYRSARSALASAIEIFVALGLPQEEAQTFAILDNIPATD